MNISSEPIIYPINSHRHIIRGTHPSIYTNAAPVAVSNKIRAIQARKSRINLQSYYDFSDIRPLHLSNPAVGTNSSTNFTHISAQKLLERSKDLRLGRLPVRHNSRPSVLSSVSTANQQSLIWPSFNNTQNSFIKQSQSNTPTVLSTAIGLPLNKLSTTHMPDIHTRTHRAQSFLNHTFTEQQNHASYLEPQRHRSLPKKPSAQKHHTRKSSKVKSSSRPTDDPKQSKLNMSENVIHFYESEDDQENVPVMDAEFEEYLQKSTIKCADWLLKYVVDKTFEDFEE